MSDDIYYAGSGADFDPELAAAALEASDPIVRVTARDRFQDVEPGISVREAMDRRNFEFFRPGEATPRRKNTMVQTCDGVYYNNPIVYFALNMMSEIVTQGIAIHHSSPAKQKRYRHWWRKVGAKRISERFVNLLFRHGWTIVKRNFAKLNLGDRRDLELGVAAVTGFDTDIDYERSVRVAPYHIPMQYTFLNPQMVDILAPELAIFTGRPHYGLRIPDNIIKAIKNPKTEEERGIVGMLPDYVMQAANSGLKVIPLDPDKISTHFYKKDDWQAYPNPLILAILKDITLYEKMKDADRAALDGSISRLRLWKLGNLENKIQPGPGAFKRLRDQLLANVGGGTMDIIWDAAIECWESSTEVHKFLGSEKYEPVLHSIYAGLGIPQTITSQSHGGKATTSLSLKTLMERLEYARTMLDDFWARELYILQQAFGDRKPAEVRYDFMSFSDEASEHQIWMNLFDRNLITRETVHEKLGLIHDIEERRLKGEYREADNGSMPAKIGPFTEAQPHPDQLAKVAMQQGTIAPSEAGVKTKPKKRGDKSLLDHQAAQQQQNLDFKKAKARRKAKAKPTNIVNNDEGEPPPTDVKNIGKVAVKGQPGQGRPRNSKDSQPRKPRVEKLAAQIQAIARENQRAIADKITPLYLSSLDKKNVRSLTTAQAKDLEDIKFATLCATPPGQPVVLDSAVLSFPAPLPDTASTILHELIADGYTSRGVNPTVDDVRDLQITAYLLLNSEPADAQDDPDN